MNMDTRAITTVVALIVAIGAFAVAYADTRSELVRASTLIQVNDKRLNAVERVVNNMPVVFEQIANIRKTLDRLDRRMARQEQFQLGGTSSDD